MLFTNSLATDIELYINNKKLERAKTLKFLGYYLDEKFSWTPHIEYIRNKISKSLGIICKLRPGLTEEIMLNMYYTFVHCYLNTGIIIWDSTHNNKIDSLIKIQKKAIRIITNSGYRDHTLPLFTKLKILPLQQLYYYNIILFIYKVYKDKLPKVISDYFKTRVSLPVRMTRRSNFFEIPTYINDFYERSILVRGYLNLIYKLNPIKHFLSVPSFKNSLKMKILCNELTLP